MHKPKPAGKKKVVFQGKTFEIVQQKFRAGKHIIISERARRAPGVRLIIIKDKKLLLTREYRPELSKFDYRLPGGKVFDSLREYKKAQGLKVNMLQAARRAGKQECLEETGLIARKLTLFQTTKAGLTVEWNLYYFIVEDFAKHKDGQHLHKGEIIYPEWKIFEEARRMCLEGKIQEDRSVGVLLKFLLTR